MKIFTITLISLFLILLFLVSISFSKTYNITFVWNRNSEPDLEGYKLYQTVNSGLYSGDPVAIIIGNPNQYTLQLNDPQVKQYFVLTAYDRAGNESESSHEVNWQADSNAPLPVNGFGIKNSTIIININN